MAAHPNRPLSSPLLIVSCALTHSMALLQSLVDERSGNLTEMLGQDLLTMAGEFSKSLPLQVQLMTYDVVKGRTLHDLRSSLQSIGDSEGAGNNGVQFLCLRSTNRTHQLS